MPKIILPYLFLIIFLCSCGQVSEVTRSLMNLRNIEFALNNVEDPKILGIDIKSKSSLEDFNLGDLLKLSEAYKNNNFDMSFVLLVEAVNPNDFDGKSLTASASISDFPYKLYLDENLVVSGNINKEFIIPANGEARMIPLEMKFNLFEIYKTKGYKPLLNIALNLSGLNTKKIDIRLEARPRISTSLGDMSPGIINVRKRID